MFGGSIGFQEVVVILILAVVLFGRRLPNVARSLGQSYQQFRKGLSDLQATIQVDDDPVPVNSDYYNGLPDYSDSYDADEDAPDFSSPSVASEESPAWENTEADPAAEPDIATSTDETPKDGPSSP